MLHNIILLIAIYFLGSILFYILLPLSKKFQLYDNPGHRKIHSHPVPFIGGFGIVLIFISTLFIITYFKFFDLSLNLDLQLIISLSLIMFIVGFIDDKLGPKFPYKLKLAAQIICALFFITYSTTNIHITGINTLDNALLLFWIIGISNSFNLIDNMDNFCSGTAISTLLILLFISILLSLNSMLIIFLLLTLAILIFVPFNYNPAKIYLGDSGALFIGFFLSTSSIHLIGLIQNIISRDQYLLAVLMLLPAFSIPITDTISVIAIRLSNKRSIFQGDTNHLSHRLNRNSLSQKQAVYTLVLINLITGLTSFHIYYIKNLAFTLLLLSGLIFLFGYWSYKLGNIILSKKV